MLGDCDGGTLGWAASGPCRKEREGLAPGSLPASSWPGFCTQGSARSVPAQLPFCSAVCGSLTPSLGFPRVLRLFLGEKQSPAPFPDAEMASAPFQFYFVLMPGSHRFSPTPRKPLAEGSVTLAPAVLHEVPFPSVSLGLHIDVIKVLNQSAIFQKILAFLHCLQHPKK